MAVNPLQSKFGRNYQLIIWPKIPFNQGVLGIPSLTLPPAAVLSAPLTIEFDISRNSLASMNYAKIRMYNLSVFHRNLIRYTRSDVGSVQQIMLRAGYGAFLPAGTGSLVINPLLPTIFFGNIRQAYSAREGNNIVTTIESYDGGIAAVHGQVNIGPFPPGTSLKAVIATLAGLAPNTLTGSIGNYVTTSTKAQSYSGDVLGILNDLAPNQVFIDNGKLNVLQNEEIIATPTPTLVSPATGLLDTPQLEQYIATFNLLFEPTLHVGQLATVVSDVEDNFAFPTPQKIVGLKHRGTISGAVCGEVVTSAQFFFTKLLVPVAQATPPIP